MKTKQKKVTINKVTLDLEKFAYIVEKKLKEDSEPKIQAIDNILTRLSSLEESVTKVEKEMDYPDEVCFDFGDGYKTYPAKFFNKSSPWCECKEPSRCVFNPLIEHPKWLDKCQNCGKPIQPKKDEFYSYNFDDKEINRFQLENSRINKKLDVLFAKSKEDRKDLRNKIIKLILESDELNEEELADKILAIVKGE